MTRGIEFEGYAGEYKISPNQAHSRKLNSLGLGESTMWEREFWFIYLTL